MHAKNYSGECKPVSSNSVCGPSKLRKWPIFTVAECSLPASAPVFPQTDPAKEERPPFDRIVHTPSLRAPDGGEDSVRLLYPSQWNRALLISLSALAVLVQHSSGPTV
ncbi:hypothetical protein AAFF_G00352460 [Aldrovandia affinis]|uniref:Uncharacterized protein n=1 Tax=Aldrovandia affinis TaxID=143900 RepID=A0AAD7SIX5_9TELE|nr:hypothetical protein AAFF_G00352460 [Aldrovandia affinis]